MGMLPPVRGLLTVNSAVGRQTWFGVGGPAEILFRPADAADLALFLSALPPEVPVTVIGVGSNLLVRDGGIPGVVIRLGRGFAGIQIAHDEVRAGAAALDRIVAFAAADAGIGGLEFLSGIPGSIGGSVWMNAGAYGREIRDVFVSVTALDRGGRSLTIDRSGMRFSYRNSDTDPGAIFVEARLRGSRGNRAMIASRLAEIRASREATQPVRARTGGSTFKNPPGNSAWRLIDAAGCRGLVRGGAMVSEMHTNFLINTGSATAADLEDLGEEVRRRVYETSGIVLEWEIERIGCSITERKYRLEDNPSAANASHSGSVQRTRSGTYEHQPIQTNISSCAWVPRSRSRAVGLRGPSRRSPTSWNGHPFKGVI
jgi:UDP-N-acetylmuramate dehydrogenase